jgi:hypothetical protein
MIEADRDKAPPLQQREFKIQAIWISGQLVFQEYVESESHRSEYLENVDGPSKGW